MKKIYQKSSIILLTIAASLLGGGSVIAQDASSAKVARLLNESKISYTKQSETVWSVPFEGKQLKDISVVVSTADPIVVVFAVVAEKKDFKLTPELMQKLLRSNQDFDRVKVGIDKDGDIFVRVDLSARLLDVEELKANVEQVSAAADEVYAFVKPSLIRK